MNFVAKIIIRIFFNTHGDYTRKPDLLNDRPWWRVWWHTKRWFRGNK